MSPIAKPRSTVSDSRSSVSPDAPADPWAEADAVSTQQTAKASTQTSQPAAQTVAQTMAEPTVPQATKPQRSPLRDSPALPLILMIWFTVVVVKAAVELTIELGVAIFALVRWFIRRYRARQTASPSLEGDLAPLIEPLATAG